MRCANAECRTESSYLRGGSLYWIEGPPGEGEVRAGRFIWLCARCVEEFVVEGWRPWGQQLRRRFTGGPPARPPRSVSADAGVLQARRRGIRW